MSVSGQLSARERIEALLDENSFVEIGALVTRRSTDFNLSEVSAPADGVITGYGTVNDCLVYIYSQDQDVLGGSIGEMHAKKICRLYDLAMKMGAPIVGLISCAGIRLQEATDALDGFGALFAKQSAASGVIPQLVGIFGDCGGGISLIPALTDFTFMVAGRARVFVNSPNTLGDKGADFNKTTSDYHEAVTGIAHVVCKEEADLLYEMRTLLSVLPANNQDDLSYDECVDSLNRENSMLNDSTNKDAVSILQEISDDNFFFEVRSQFAPEMITGFIRLNGVTVGAVANCLERSAEDGDSNMVTKEYEPRLTTDGCEKAGSFVNFCDAFSIPILTITNTKGFQTTLAEEKTIAKAAAQLTNAFVQATVPKLNLIVGESFGTAYVVMNSRHIGADIVYAWPKASIGMMDSQSAARIMYADAIQKAENGARELAVRTQEYEELQSDIRVAASRGYIDDVIEPQATRKRVIAAMEMLFTKTEMGFGKKHHTI